MSSKEENFKLFCELRGQEVEIVSNGFERGILCGYSERKLETFMIMVDEGHYVYCDKIRPIKKPEYKPWTAETIPFPLAVKVKGSSNGFRSLVSAGIDDAMLLYFYGGDSVVDCVSYKELLNDYETRDDQPCGEVVGDE